MPHPTNDLLRRLFERALELPPPARATFLDSKCGNDTDLRRRLVAMIAAAEDEPAAPAAAPTPAPGPAATAPAAPAEATLREGPGSRIGPYKLLQQIGEGGFGVVFMAEQEQPVARKVALKIIKLGMDTRQVVARFEQERQALAMMDHPNIARVLDAGATETGRPYFVMDLCKGDPIVDYCDKNNLTIDERLDLMAQVCRAVQHAHHKGIIHRDLKPSNILVCNQDGRPVAKVIDFGIAKATSQKLTEKTLFTEHQQVIGTLAYMSPEQAEGSMDIDTRSDVYSLGVLLYELLTGSTPFDVKTARNAVYSELQRMIREVEPAKPSTRLSESHDTLANIAAHRRVEPRRLGLLLRGELDWIVMKALEKDRTRRYETANGLAMDISRYLAGEPVVAAPPSAAYRLHKFIRRHRAGVAAVAAVGVSLLVGVIGFAWQAEVAAGERDTARTAQQAEAAERARAESNERRADAINTFLLDMLGAADLRKQGRGATVAQALDQAAQSVGSSFQDRPEVEAAVRAILGRTYMSLGMVDQAEPHVSRGLELAQRVHGERSVDYARMLADRSSLEHLRGREEAALQHSERALAILRDVCGAEHKQVLTMQCDHANALVRMQRHAEAEQLLRSTRDTYRRVNGADDGNTQIMCNSLAVLLHERNQLDEAEALYREALAIGERVLGADHPDTLTARMNLGSMLRARGRLQEAEPVLLDGHARITRVFGDAHPRTAESAGVLAKFFDGQGRIKDALPRFEEALAIRRRIEGERTEAVADLKRMLGLNLMKAGEAARAVTALRDVLEIWIALEGPDGPRTLNAGLDLANTLVAAKRFDEAEPYFKDLLERCPRLLGDDNETTIIATNSYAVFLLGQQRYADAEPFLQKALEVGRRAQGPDHRNTLITQCNLCSALRELGRLDEAERLGRETLDGFQRVFGARHINLATAHSSLGETLAKLGRNDDAQAQFEAAIAVAKAAAGDKNPAFTSAALLLGRLLIDTGRAAAAEPLLREALDVSTTARGASDPRTANTRLELGRCLSGLQHFADAEPLLLDSHAALAAARRPGHSDVRRAERYLAAHYAAWNTAEPDVARAGKAGEWQAKAAAEASSGK